MWERIKLPGYIAERFIGFSLPADDKVLIISYDGVQVLDIIKGIIIENNTDLPEGGKPFDKNLNIFRFNEKNYKIIGLFGADNSILKNSGGDNIIIHKDQQTMTVLNRQEEITFEFNYEDTSGDWCVSTFSCEGDYILLGLPYDIYIFKKV